MYLSFDYNQSPQTGFVAMDCDGNFHDCTPLPVKRIANMEWMKRSQCTWPFRMRGRGTRDRKFALKHRTDFGIWLIDYYKKHYPNGPSGRIPKYLKKIFAS